MSEVRLKNSKGVQKIEHLLRRGHHRIVPCPASISTERQSLRDLA